MKVSRWQALVVVVGLFGPRIQAEESSWKGLDVVAVKPDKQIKMGDTVGGKEVYFPFKPRLAQQPVREESEGWLRIYDGHREGWVDKADFVLARDSTAYFHRRVQANPKDTWALCRRGSGWLAKDEYDNAIADFNELIRLDPTDAAAYTARGIAWRRKKELDRAIKDFDEAIRLKPVNALTYLRRGSTWQEKKHLDKAMKDFGEAIRLEPNWADAYWERARGWEAKAEYEIAIKDLKEAIRIDPKDHEPLNLLAWLIATCPEARLRDGKSAIEFAKQACKLSAWKIANDIDTLAAAYAEDGEFDEAVRYQTMAIEMAAQEQRDDYNSRLTLYKAKTPYRQK